MENCKICNTISSGTYYYPKEMMLGKRDTFKYFECENCGCLQLIEPPADLITYYPDNYYSLEDTPEIHFRGKIKPIVKAIRDFYIITGRRYLGALIQFLYPNKSIELFNFRLAKLKKSSKILDIGSGQGIIPYVFYNAGFKNTLGLDPFIKKSITYLNGLRIIKKDFLTFNEVGWDMIMFNHSFEHLAQPKAYLNKVHEILNTNGICIIRIPTTSSYAWENYRENWVQLDAPRHFFLYSVESINKLAKQTGFIVSSIADESTFFQYVGSEQYKNNISLTGDAKSYFKGNQSLFTKVEIENYKQKALELNNNRQGDSIAIILKKQ